MSKQFTCAICGETFECGWSEEEALKELKERFGDIPTSECDLICDPCDKKVQAWQATLN